MPRGGAAESSLSVHLNDYSTTINTRDQMVIQEYADALLIIPKTLALNATKDASKLVARSIHAKG